MFNWFKSKQGNRERVAYRLRQIETVSAPAGWERRTEIAVGGLSEVGFSKATNHLLVVSSNGRGVIDCQTGERVARDYEEYGSWYDSLNMTCLGIGPLDGELISIAGLCGGGLPVCNRYGESLEVAAPEWPDEDVYFCPPNKSAFINGHQAGCCRIFRDQILSMGFSWNGAFIAVATSSDVTVWQRQCS